MKISTMSRGQIGDYRDEIRYIVSRWRSEQVHAIEAQAIAEEMSWQEAYTQMQEISDIRDAVDCYDDESVWQYAAINQFDYEQVIELIQALMVP